jgi:hypothetical protein
MGLVERRAAKTFAEGKYVQFKQEIDTATGFEVEMVVNWDSLAIEDYAHLYEEAFTQVYFRPLLGAIKAVNIDDLGQEALKTGLKQILIENRGSRWPTFEAGVLTLPFDSVANLDDWSDRQQSIQDILEESL